MKRYTAIALLAIFAQVFGVCGCGTAATSADQNEFGAAIECTDGEPCASCVTNEGAACRTGAFRLGWCTSGECIDCTSHECGGVPGCSADASFAVHEAGADTCPPGCYPACEP